MGFERRRAPKAETHKCKLPINWFGIRFGEGARWRCGWPRGMGNDHYGCGQLWEYGYRTAGSYDPSREWFKVM
jgi:hypothetical protein